MYRAGRASRRSVAPIDCVSTTAPPFKRRYLETPRVPPNLGFQTEVVIVYIHANATAPRHFLWAPRPRPHNNPIHRHWSSSQPQTGTSMAMPKVLHISLYRCMWLGESQWYGRTMVVVGCFKNSCSSEKTPSDISSSPRENTDC